MKQFYCVDCKQSKPVQKGGGTGYASLENDDKVCYACCGLRDAKAMREGNKIDLYLTNKENICMVTNWPGTLKIPVGSFKTGRHNIARSRTDVWFRFENTNWHGVLLGHNTQIVRCKKLKT